MEITNEQRKQLQEYLSRRPYAEVFTLVAMLVSLKPEPKPKPKPSNGKEKDAVTRKNQWVQSKNYIKNLKNLHHKFPGIGLKILAFLACLICWATMLIGTFLLLN